MSYVIEKKKHEDLKIEFTLLSNVIAKGLTSLPLNSVSELPDQSRMKVSYKNYTRTKCEAHNMRMQITALEGVLKELKKLNDKKVN